MKFHSFKTLILLARDQFFFSSETFIRAVTSRPSVVQPLFNMYWTRDQKVSAAAKLRLKIHILIIPHFSFLIRQHSQLESH